MQLISLLAPLLGCILMPPILQGHQDLILVDIYMLRDYMMVGDQIKKKQTQ